MNILITGVAGFIGSNLADRLLQSGHRVVGIDNLAYGVKEQIPPKVELHQADIRSQGIYPLFKKIDFVFHLAAKNCISDCQNDPVETADINVNGTVNVFEAARRAKVKKVIYAESSALYEGCETFPTPEDCVRPQSVYAISKMAAMQFAKGYEEQFGLATTALRYFNVYGPRQDYRRSIPPLMSAIIIKLLNGDAPVIYGNGQKRRDFIHVDDVNDFHCLCLTDKRTTGKVFNLGASLNYSVLDIYDQISRLLGTNIKPVFKPDLPGEAQQTLADITQAKALGWQPRVSLDDGLKSMIQYIKKECKALV